MSASRCSRTISGTGDRLDRLDALVGVSLPPIQHHETRGTLTGHTNGRYDATISLAIEDTEFTGTLDLVAGRQPVSGSSAIAAKISPALARSR